MIHITHSQMIYYFSCPSIINLTKVNLKMNLHKILQTKQITKQQDYAQKKLSLFFNFNQENIIKL